MPFWADELSLFLYPSLDNQDCLCVPQVSQIPGLAQDGSLYEKPQDPHLPTEYLLEVSRVKIKMAVNLRKSLLRFDEFCNFLDLHDINSYRHIICFHYDRFPEFRFSNSRNLDRFYFWHRGKDPGQCTPDKVQNYSKWNHKIAHLFEIDPFPCFIFRVLIVCQRMETLWINTWQEGQRSLITDQKTKFIY